MAPPIDSRNILRPETVESLYIAFQLTGDPLYREWGWSIFQAFQRWCQVDKGYGGYAGIDDVDSLDHQLIDRMETYVRRQLTLDSGFLKHSSIFICSSPRATKSHSDTGFSTRRPIRSLGLRPYSPRILISHHVVEHGRAVADSDTSLWISLCSRYATREGT